VCEYEIIKQLHCDGIRCYSALEIVGAITITIITSSFKTPYLSMFSSVQFSSVTEFMFHAVL